MSTPPANPTLTLETALAEQLGISRDRLGEIREKLAPEIDWQKKGNAIAYTPEGLAKITAALALDRPPAPANGATGAGVRTVFVKRKALRNARLIFVTPKKEEGAELPVRVRDAAMFVPGQAIRVREDGSGLRLHGRQPTRKGRA